MKKTVATIFSIILSLPLYGQQDQNPWKISTIENKDKVTIGHIYHTYAIGTSYGPTEQKTSTGLRIICSVNSADTPVIAVYWKDYSAVSAKNNQPVNVLVDDKEIATTAWSTDTNLIYKPLVEANNIVLALKTGKTVEFSWKNPERKKTKFDIVKFNTNYDNFIKLCNIK